MPLALADTLGRYAIEHRAYLHGGPLETPGVGHWNETGHRIAAGAVADALCSTSPVVRALVSPQ
jgi:hypothetical protein